MLKPGIKKTPKAEKHPFKIMNVSVCDGQDTLVKFHGTSRHSIMECTVEEILSDPHLVEGFHQKEALLLGFLSFNDLLLNKHKHLDSAKKECVRLLDGMLGHKLNEKNHD